MAQDIKPYKIQVPDAALAKLKAKLAASEHLLEQLMARISLPDGAAQSEPVSAKAEPNISAHADAAKKVTEGRANSDQLFPLADQVTGSAAPRSREADDEQA